MKTKEITVQVRIVAGGKTYLLLDRYPIKDMAQVTVTSVDQLQEGVWTPYRINLMHTDYVLEFPVQPSAVCIGRGL